MLDHLPEIVADLKKMEQANQPLSPDIAANIAKGKAPSFGPENAKVTVVEFSDFQCPYCSKAADVVDQVKEKVRGSRAFSCSASSRCRCTKTRAARRSGARGNAQGKFWQFHDKLFKNQGSSRATASKASPKKPA